MTVVNHAEQVTVIDQSETAAVIIAPGAQGPPGRNGVDGATISPDPDNRLENRPNGLFVSNTLNPDPLAYYILAKS